MGFFDQLRPRDLGALSELNDFGHARTRHVTGRSSGSLSVRRARSRASAGARAFMEIGAVHGRGDKARGDDVIAEAFAVAALTLIATGAFPDQADLGEIRPGAAVGTNGHADDDVILGKPVRAPDAAPAR